MYSEMNDTKRTKIRFKTERDELKGFEILLRSGIPTHATADDKYIITDKQCKMLKEKNIEYECE
jgi:hypothetical protein